MTVKFDETGLAIESGPINVFYYDSQTKEYISSSEEYVYEGVSIPGNSTTDEPPEFKEGVVSVYINGEWVEKEDHRNKTVYCKKNLQPSIVDYIGAIDDDYTLLTPSTPFDKWSGKAWVTDEKAKKEDEISSVLINKNMLIAEATMKIAPLVDAKDGGYIDDEDLPILTAWQKYRYALTKVDINKPVWPEKPE